MDNDPTVKSEGTKVYSATPLNSKLKQQLHRYCVNKCNRVKHSISRLTTLQTMWNSRTVCSTPPQHSAC